MKVSRPMAIIILTLSCSPADNFLDSTEKSTTISLDKPGSQVEANEDLSPHDPDSFTTAVNEPVMVGGAFLSCSVDTNLSDEANLGFGCAVFEDQSLTAKSAFVDQIYIERASLVENGASTVEVSMTRIETGDWHWNGKAPRQFISNQKLSISLLVRNSSNPMNSEAIVVPINSVMPLSVALESSDLGSRDFYLQHADSGLCLSGPSRWSYDLNTDAAIVTSLGFSECSSAQPVRFQAYDSGYRITTPNPNATQCFFQEFCELSCIDLVDYANSDQVAFYGCTYTAEAQSFSLEHYSQSRDRAASFLIRGLGEDRYIAGDSNQGTTHSRGSQTEALKLQLLIVE
ncbi:hypothetical protein [Pseudobacteriovorax antillogorgiicola]|uniref:Uncharacterized protein n=1 Tax=Pseudobacteriovorax antillogorgiicola TaxID=1513793 RepID=A0A1Y6BQY7_9BACT|nr:hypothetical protein [Pseudobacteriovorax antillogorgiicola]TCS53181.1 hypothetical protein EDD56_108232 [Pseudobacteriovorax antillogorgiicola]SMF24546.1 hypothetical protein SAMN06296036_10814 [Pseudobacteriovorax antillogorgiicola]